MRISCAAAPRSALVLILVLVLVCGGCASARFEARHADCELPDRTEAAALLGYTLELTPPPSFGAAAAASYVAAPPWVIGQDRVYPWDNGYNYVALALEAGGRAETPLLCEIDFERRQGVGIGGGPRWVFFTEDPFTQADLAVVYEVEGKGPPMRITGITNAAHVSLVDATNHLEEGDLLHLAISDVDNLRGFVLSADDALARFDIPYAEQLAASTGVRWRGETTVRCRHLDPAATERALAETLDEIDRRLAAFVPSLEIDAWNFGLSASLLHIQELLVRAASLDPEGWADEGITARAERALGEQACFEQAAVDAVEGRAAHARVWGPKTLANSRWRARAFSCAPPPEAPPADWPEGRCTLELEVSNEWESEAWIGRVEHAWVVLAGGREVDAWLEGPDDLASGERAIVSLRLDSSVAADVPLTRPVLLRTRRRRLFGRPPQVEDRALWKRGESSD